MPPPPPPPPPPLQHNNCAAPARPPSPWWLRAGCGCATGKQARCRRPRLLRTAAPPLSLAVRNTSPAESPSKPRTQGDGTRDLPEDSMKVSLPACPCSHLGPAPQSWRAVITAAHKRTHTSNANVPKPCLHEAGGLAIHFLAHSHTSHPCPTSLHLVQHSTSTSPSTTPSAVKSLLRA